MITTPVTLPPMVARPALVTRRELIAVVRELRRFMWDEDGPPARVLARKRAMVERLAPGWYEDLDDDYGEDDAELDATDMLERLVGGGQHAGLEPPRPTDPQSREWAAYVEQRRAVYATAVEALDVLELDCAAYGGSFPDSLREVLEEVAKRRGGSEELVETRPGSWEADHIRGLTAGVDYDLRAAYLQRAGTQ